MEETLCVFDADAQGRRARILRSMWASIQWSHAGRITIRCMSRCLPCRADQLGQQNDDQKEDRK